MSGRGLSAAARSLGMLPPRLAALVVVGAVALAGCGVLRNSTAHPSSAAPGTPAATPTATLSASASAAASGSAGASAAVEPDEAGCVAVAEDIGNDDFSLVGVAQVVFRRLGCSSGDSLGAQLASVAADPTTTQMASSARVSLQLAQGPRGASLSLYSDSGACVVTISERPRTKSLTCG